MAIVANQADTKFKMVLNAGLDENNKEITKNKTFPGVKVDTTNEVIYNVATSLAALQSYTLTDIKKYEEFDLVEE